MDEDLGTCKFNLAEATGTNWTPEVTLSNLREQKTRKKW